MDDGEGLTYEGLRDLVVDCRGSDPGRCDDGTRLDDIELTDLTLLCVVATLEAQHRIEFPADLVSALETVGDLVHFTNVKIDQRTR